MTDTLSRAALTERFTAPGQPFEIGEREVRGIPMRVFTAGPQTLREIALSLGAFGERPFLVFRDERWTYAEQARIIAGLARCLREEYGLRKGDRVAVSMRNYPEWTPVFWATQLLGIVLVPLNAWWTAPELRYAIEDAGARLVIVDGERAALLAPHLDSLGNPPLVEVRGTGTTGRGWDELLASLDPAAEPPDADVEPDDDATILYTSGTTGQPKGAIGTHRNHCTNLFNTALSAFVSGAMANGGEPVVPDPAAPQPGGLCTFPLFHIAGITSIGYTAMVGGKLVTQYKWDRDEARALVRRERLTAVSGVPTVIRSLLDDAAEDTDGLGTLAGISMGGAPVPPDLVGGVDQVFDALVAPSNGYGLTETTSAVVANVGSDYVARPDSVGRCQPGTEVRVVDPGTGEDVGEGEIGELWFRGPNIVRGYWKNPEATAAAFTDGWFHTGDLGRVSEGWVFVVDRMKDVIIRGGENIYCAEVEAVLFRHPAVEDVTVVGVPHPTLGEEAVAVVVPREGMSVTAEEIRRHVAAGLAAFKVPAHVLIRSEPLPRTPSGKVLKRDLRPVLAAEVEAR
ncbi:acyl--CoA ligase [Amycolatopsis acidicola]|uniref:Acyl--CoA ligase n=1 Tax=Amycolatopsis acidicola TaxID=2596893 RepID=A0A5N0V087_9PSEU|nr:class I adenylate-forming enzyme family protein [Amycolatopsis acidicola]KAA9159622.1 acyl--CoA ligase [Amycolatopsis acidicola]